MTENTFYAQKSLWSHLVDRVFMWLLLVIVVVVVLIGWVTPLYKMGDFGLISAGVGVALASVFAFLAIWNFWIVLFERVHTLTLNELGVKLSYYRGKKVMPWDDVGVIVRQKQHIYLFSKSGELPLVVDLSVFPESHWGSIIAIIKTSHPAETEYHSYL